MNESEINFNYSKDEYGEKFNDHTLEIYKLYVQMADNISSRRQTVNSFFLSINTAIVGLISYVHLGVSSYISKDFFWIIGVVGLIISFLWYKIIISYKNLNTGKFKVIHLIESELPISAYDIEWKLVGEGEESKLYLPFTHIEKYIPWAFFILHLVVIIRSIF